MPRRTVLAIPLPADVEDVLLVLQDVAKGWAAARVENGPVLESGEAMLVISASRRRAQKPAPDEEPDEDEPHVADRPVPLVYAQEYASSGNVATDGMFGRPSNVSHARDTEHDPVSALVLASLAAVETPEPSVVDDEPVVDEAGVDEPGEWLDAFESTGT